MSRSRLVGVSEMWALMYLYKCVLRDRQEIQTRSPLFESPSLHKLTVTYSSLLQISIGCRDIAVEKDRRRRPQKGREREAN